MIGDLFQSSPVDVFNIDIIQTSQPLSHDALVGVAVLPTVGQGCKGMSQNSERYAFGPFDVQGINEFGELLGDLIDVRGLGILHPGLAVALSENQVIAVAQDGADGHYRFRPQRDISDRLALIPDGLDSSRLQINVGYQQAGAVGSPVSTIHTEQDHCLDLPLGGIDEAANVGRGEQAAFFIPPQFPGAGFFEVTTHPYPVDPSTVCGVVEHSHDAGAFTVIGIGSEFASTTEIPTINGEFFGAQIIDLPGTSDVLEKSTDGIAVIGNMPAADIACQKLSFLFVNEQVGQLLDIQRSRFDDGPWSAPFIQIVLDPFVLGQRFVAVPIAPEIVQVPQDSLLKSAVRAGLGGESLDGLNLVTTDHADTLSKSFDYCKCIQLSSQIGCGTIHDMNNTTDLPNDGSVAQRKSRGLIIPVANPAANKNHDIPAIGRVAPSAQVPNGSTDSSRLNTEIPSPDIIGGFAVPSPCVYFLFKSDELIYVGSSVALFNRLATHVRTKDFDRVIYLTTPIEKLRWVESAFITVLRPKRNFCSDRLLVPFEISDEEAARVVDIYLSAVTAAGGRG